jgi:hypothetical protein
MTPPGWTLSSLMRLFAGLLIWASAFVFLYAGFSLGCQVWAPSPEDGLRNPVTAVLALFAGIHLVALGILTWLWWTRPVAADIGESETSRRVRHRVEGLVLACSIFALIWVAFPIFMVAPCAG